MNYSFFHSDHSAANDLLVMMSLNRNEKAVLPEAFRDALISGIMASYKKASSCN